MKTTQDNSAVVVDHAPNPDGSAAQTSWTFRDPEQAAAHLAQFEAGVQVIAERKANGEIRYATEKISKGDASALRDKAEEARKQRES